MLSVESQSTTVATMPNANSNKTIFLKKTYDDKECIPSNVSFKQGMINSASEDDDSYDELDMYESLRDHEVTAKIPVEPKSSKALLADSSDTIGNLQVNEERPCHLDEPDITRIETVVKRKKFRKVRCSKLIKRANDERTTQKIGDVSGQHSVVTKLNTVSKNRSENKMAENDEHNQSEKMKETASKNRINDTCTADAHGRSKHLPSNKANIVDVVSRHGRAKMADRRNLTQSTGGVGKEEIKYHNSNKNTEQTHSVKLTKGSSGFYQCDFCCKQFKNRGSLKDHYTTHTGETPHTCDECGLSFRLREYLRIHKLRKHSTERMYVCAVCDKSFTTLNYLTVHVNSHTKTRFLCDMCGSDFSALQTLKQHIKCRHLEILPSTQVQADGTHPLKCFVCDKTFSHPTNLTLHMQAHEGTQKHGCDICNALFSRKADRDRHRMRHTGEKPLKCNKCEYRCIQPGDLNRHKLSHDGAAQKCPHCQKTFVRKFDLKAHVALHELLLSGRPPCPKDGHVLSQTAYPCRVCDVNFINRHWLKKHMAEVHKTTFACLECGQEFTSVSNRNKHIERRHSKGVFSCNICEKTFKCKSNLHDHSRRVHKQSTNA